MLASVIDIFASVSGLDATRAVEIQRRCHLIVTCLLTGRDLTQEPPVVASDTAWQCGGPCALFSQDCQGRLIGGGVALPGDGGRICPGHRVTKAVGKKTDDLFRHPARWREISRRGSPRVEVFVEALAKM